MVTARVELVEPVDLQELTEPVEPVDLQELVELLGLQGLLDSHLLIKDHGRALDIMWSMMSFSTIMQLGSL